MSLGWGAGLPMPHRRTFAAGILPILFGTASAARIDLRLAWLGAAHALSPGRSLRASLPFAHSEVAALSPSGLRWPPTPARGHGHPSLVVDCEELPCTQRPQAAPRAQARRCDASSSRRAPPPRGGHGRLDAGCRPAGRTLAATTPGQACGGHGWRCHSRRRIPSGLLRLTRGSPGGRAIARLVAPWLRPRRAKPAGAMDGPAGAQSRKPESSSLRAGACSLRTALASICRIRSRVTLKMWPTSSSV